MFLRVLAVSAHGVQANDVLDLSGLEGGRLDLFPFLCRRFVGGVSIFSLLLPDLFVFSIKCSLFGGLSVSLGFYLEKIAKGSVKGLFKETGLVFEFDSHVGAELRNVEVVHLGVAHNFFSLNVLRQLLGLWLRFIRWFGWGVVRSRKQVLERDSFILFQNFVN